MELSQDQRALRDAVRGLLARHQGDDDSVPWRRLCGEIGVAGLAIPERYGGAGAGPVEIHIVMEELGRRLTPAPMLGSAVLATRALLTAGDDAACRRLLPGLAAGTTIAALAWTGPAGHWNPAEVACRASAETPDVARRASGEAPDAAVRASAEAAVTGEAHYVLDGADADVLLVAADGQDGIGLYEVDPAQPRVSRTAVTTMDQTRRMATVRLDDAFGWRLGQRLDLRPVRDLACIALSAEQIGAARQALDLTVAYTKVREQFGRVIGSFQGLQHRLADLHVLVESARSLSYAAAEAAADEAPDLGLHAAAARACCSEALTRAAAEMIQMHGAIGITWEHDAHRYFKRAHGDAQLLGPPSEHLARIAASLLDPDPARRTP
jgi:alkylation response protein AidB-like acyl-CoA dehydrogenase